MACFALAFFMATSAIVGVSARIRLPIGDSPIALMERAISNNNPVQLQNAILNGADVNSIHTVSNAPVIFHSLNPDSKTIHVLLKNMVDLDVVQPGTGNSPLAHIIVNFPSSPDFSAILSTGRVNLNSRLNELDYTLPMLRR